jgi:hypothetical protein
MSITKITSGNTFSILDTNDMASKDAASVAPNSHIQGQANLSMTGTIIPGFQYNVVVGGRPLATISNPG